MTLKSKPWDRDLNPEFNILECALKNMSQDHMISLAKKHLRKIARDVINKKSQYGDVSTRDILNEIAEKMQRLMNADESIAFASACNEAGIDARKNTYQYETKVDTIGDICKTIESKK